MSQFLKTLTASSTATPKILAQPSKTYVKPRVTSTSTATIGRKLSLARTLALFSYTPTIKNLNSMTRGGVI